MNRRSSFPLLALCLGVGFHSLNADAAAKAPSRAPAVQAHRSAAVVQPTSAPVAPVPAAYPFAQTRPGSLKIKPFVFNPPQPRREVLPNGLVVYILEDHDLPVFNVAAYTKVGEIYTPLEKAGLADLTGTVLRTGGTERRTGDEIDQALEFVGARIETGIGLEYGTASGVSLQKDSGLVLQTLNDILRHPAFREDKLDLARAQLLESIRRQNDDPEQIAGREFNRLIYGRESPWARVPTLQSARGITRDDLIQFHHRFYHPNNTILAVSGDFKSDAMLNQIRQTFGSWEKAPVEYPAFTPAQDVQGRHVYVVNKDLPQTTIYLGHLGITRHSPDRPAVAVLNEVLGGGGFTSHLMREVRSNRGLAYSVGGGVGVGADRGIFMVGAQTKTESAAEATQLMAKIVSDMRTQPVSPAEVDLAKESILNSYVFKFDSPFEIVSQSAEYEMLDYPPDYFKTYPAKIRAVTPADVRTVAQKYLHPDQMVYLFVGNTTGMDRALASLGTVSPLALDSTQDASQASPPSDKKVP